MKERYSKKKNIFIKNIDGWDNNGFIFITEIKENTSLMRNYNMDIIPYFY